MRLFEFDTTPTTIKTALGQYIDQGYELIGDGASAKVFGTDSSPDVVKVGLAQDCWLNIAKTKNNNAHLPDVKSLKMYGDHYLAVVEKLRPVKETFFKTGLFTCIASWLYLNGKWQNGRDVYLNRYKDDQIEIMAKDLETNKPDIVSALKVIIGAKGSCNFDMHPENMMRRPSDNTLVFQDPLTHQG
jgi:hypothetical protein